MRLVNILGASSVQHPEHGEAVAGADGVFEVPEAFGEALLAHAAQWRTEADHISEVSRKALEELADPKRAAAVLHYVHGRVKDLEQRVAELEGKAADAEQPEQPPEKPAKPATKTDK